MGAAWSERDERVRMPFVVLLYHLCIIHMAHVASLKGKGDTPPVPDEPPVFAYGWTLGEDGAGKYSAH